MLSLGGGPECRIHIRLLTSKLKEMDFLMYTDNDENCGKELLQSHTELLYTRL